MKQIAYIRKSTEDKSNKQIQSKEDQKSWANSYAIKNQMSFDISFDDSKTGKIPRIRDGFNAMTDYIAEYPNEKVIIVSWKLNRISRNPIDGGLIQYLLSQDKIEIHTSDGVYDKNTNQILLGVMFGEASQYSIELSKNVTRGMDSKVMKGWMPGIAPTGYLNDKAGNQGERKIFADEKNFDILQGLWQTLLQGTHTLSELFRESQRLDLRNRNGNRVSRSAFFEIFNNPFYYGKFLRSGQLYNGSHRAMITKEEFDKAQAILGHEGKAKPQKRFFTYAGMIKCGECKMSVIAEPPKTKFIKSTGRLRIYNYVRCSKKSQICKCKQKSITKENLNYQIMDLACSLHIPKAMADWAMNLLSRKCNEGKDDLVRKRSQIQRRYNENEVMIEKAAIKNVDGTLDDKTYTKLRSQFEDKRNCIKTELDKYDTNKDNWLDEVKATFEFVQLMKGVFEGSDENMKKFVLLQSGSNFFLKDGIFTYELHNPLKNIQTALYKSNLGYAGLEPVDVRFQTDLINDHAHINPVWYTQQDSNLRPLP